MFNRIFFLLLLVSFSTHVMSDEVPFSEILKIKNDKEVLISSFSQRERDFIVQKFQDQEEREKIKNTFYSTLHFFLNENTNHCELHFMKLLEESFAKANLPHDEFSIEEQLKLIRIYHGMDDILYEILSSDNKDYFALKKLNTTNRPKRTLLQRHNLVEKNNLKELYSNFETFPDEINNCAYQEFIFLKNHIKGEDDRKSRNPLKDLKILNKKALQDNIISLESYHKLEFLRDGSRLNQRLVFLKEYLKIIFNAKNQMVPAKRDYRPIKLEDEDKFSSERVKRFSSLTRRKLLYKKYDETQIIMLAQALQKASRRMGVDPDTESSIPYISQEFTVQHPNGERQTYVERIDLDPQSQFNLARRLLRKDITELQMMDTFNGLSITYEDIIMAAFETGYITIEDITHVVRYDDLWNPEATKYQRISGFVFKVTGYSTFFLPTPWNIVGTIAIGVVEGLVDKKLSTGVENDNPSTFIE